MPIQNADLFKGLMIVSEISQACVVDELPEGTIIYGPTDKADYFYILLKGSVQLLSVENSKTSVVVNKEGEIFGWSSMAGRDFYTMTAKCLTSASVVRISKNRLNHIFEKHPHDGMLFYKRLSAAILQRLVDTSSALLSENNK